MRVISTSSGYRAAVGSLFLLVPLAGFEAFLASRMPWWRLPLATIAWTAGAVAAIVIILGIALLRGRAWALSVATVLAAAWVAFSAGLSLRLKHPGLGYFVIFLGVACYCVLAWVRHEMLRSFFDPGLAWYEGLPKGIPGLSCELGSTPKNSPWKVGRIDREGVFVFADTGNRAGDLKGVRAGVQELLFRFRDREIKCSGIAMRELVRGVGAGFRFAGLTLDQKKELGDFVETLRGESYVE